MVIEEQTYQNTARVVLLREETSTMITVALMQTEDGVIDSFKLVVKAPHTFGL